MKKVLSSLFAILAICPAAVSKIVVENDAMRLTLSEEGYATSLVVKENGRECLKKGIRQPLCSILQDRPYDNENFLMFPAKPRAFASNSIRREADTLFVEFEDTYDIAVIRMDIQPRYISFTLERIDYRLEDFGVKRKTEIDELALIQLPVKEQEHFGEWLNVSWGKKSAVCLLGTVPETRIDAFKNDGWRNMYAGADFEVQLEGTGAALVAEAGAEKLLDDIAVIESDFGMPRGVESRRSNEYRYSYYEVRDVTPDNVDRHIAYAQEGGFRQMVIYYPDFAFTCGHYLYNQKYPGGLEDLKGIVQKMKAAGMTVGFHIHYSKVSVDDPYICSGTPDKRLNFTSQFTLSRDIAAEDDVIYVEQNPSVTRTEDGRRLLLIGDEFVSYEGISPVKPYCFIGCKRGICNTIPTAQRAGACAMQPDVDDWPRFIRIDQNTGIQDEISERIAEIYDSCGFEFIYFDGAEDVPAPYWYNVSKAQLSVWSHLKTPMLFAEGALKSHYGWHLLSRGNAFDHFKDEYIRKAMDKYTLRCARQIACDFTSIDFGWLLCDLKPESYEYVCSKAAEYGCPISYVAILDRMDACPTTDESLAIIRKWEDRK